MMITIIIIIIILYDIAVYPVHEPGSDLVPKANHILASWVIHPTSRATSVAPSRRMLLPH
jgi:hypothetical protein